MSNISGIQGTWTGQTFNVFVSGGSVGASPFARGATLLTPTGPQNVVVWQAPFPCTVTNVRGYTVDTPGAVVNALRNALPLLASNLTLGSLGTWLDGGAVQNQFFAVGDTLTVELISIVGSPSQIVIQVDFTRP